MKLQKQDSTVLTKQLALEVTWKVRVDKPLEYDSDVTFEYVIKNLNNQYKASTEYEKSNEEKYKSNNPI